MPLLSVLDNATLLDAFQCECLSGYCGNAAQFDQTKTTGAKRLNDFDVAKCAVGQFLILLSRLLGRRIVYVNRLGGFIVRYFAH